MTPTTVRVKIFHTPVAPTRCGASRPVTRFAKAILFETSMRDGVESVLRDISTAVRIAPSYGGPPKREWAIEYRHRHHWRLEIGDVVVVGEQAWAVRDLPPARRQRFPEVWPDIGRMELTAANA